MRTEVDENEEKDDFSDKQSQRQHQRSGDDEDGNGNVNNDTEKEWKKERTNESKENFHFLNKLTGHILYVYYEKLCIKNFNIGNMEIVITLRHRNWFCYRHLLLLPLGFLVAPGHINWPQVKWTLCLCSGWSQLTHFHSPSRIFL